MQVTAWVSLRAENAVSKHKWGYKFKNFPLPFSLDPSANCQQVRNEPHLPAGVA